MFSIEQAYTYMRMIDDDELITADEVSKRYSIAPDVLKRAVTAEELPVLNMFGAEYHLRDVIELYVKNKNG